MAEKIINRIAKNQDLVSLDLESFYPQGKRVPLDIKAWLDDTGILREKHFREQIQAQDWKRFQDAYVALHCSVDVILPAWAYLLVTAAVSPFAKKVVLGDISQLEVQIFTDILSNLSLAPYRNKIVLIKGCANLPIPDAAYLVILERLIPVAKSIRYGEACSSVPIYKKHNQN